jgi:hypothetical protein
VLQTSPNFGYRKSYHGRTHYRQWRIRCTVTILQPLIQRVLMRQNCNCIRRLGSFWQAAINFGQTMRYDLIAASFLALDIVAHNCKVLLLYEPRYRRALMSPRGLEYGHSQQTSSVAMAPRSHPAVIDGGGGLLAEELNVLSDLYESTCGVRWEQRYMMQVNTSV